MLLEELSDGLSFVRGKIVGDDVNPKGARIRSLDSSTDFRPLL